MKPAPKICILLLTCSMLFPLWNAEALAKIGIITALNTTTEGIQKRMNIKKFTPLAGRNFYAGNLGQAGVVLVQSPMGKVNNAITTQLLISEFSVQAVLSFSPAGAIGSNIKEGDIVMATEVYQHDFGAWKPYGFIWNKAPVHINSMSTEYNLFPGRFFPPGKGIDIIADTQRDRKISHGVIVSGDQFIASPEKRDWIRKKFTAAAVDMGAAAIAQVCYTNHTPVCLIRIITDNAGLNAKTDFANSMPAYRTDIDLAEMAERLAGKAIQ